MKIILLGQTRYSGMKEKKLAGMKVKLLQSNSLRYEKSLLDYYEDLGKLIRVPAEAEEETVAQRIYKALKN